MRALDLLLPCDATTEGVRRLRELLQRQTIRAVAKRVGCTHPAVRRWALERYRPSRIHRATMDRVLKIGPAEWDEPARSSQAAAP